MVLTLVIPAVSSGTGSINLKSPLVPMGSAHGHTGHVRFLTSIELPEGIDMNFPPTTESTGGFLNVFNSWIWQQQKNCFSVYWFLYINVLKCVEIITSGEVEKMSDLSCVKKKKAQLSSNYWPVTHSFWCLSVQSLPEQQHGGRKPPKARLHTSESFGSHPSKNQPSGHFWRRRLRGLQTD